MKQLLIVDDEPHASRVLSLTLEREGFSVKIAPNGARAFELIEQAQPDALITDVQMPVMTGRELCEKVQSHFPDSEFPIFVLTSRAELDARDWVRKIRNAQLFEKPVSVRGLLHDLKRVLGHE